MKRFQRLRPNEIDSLLRGRAPADARDLDALADFRRAVVDLCREEPSPAVQARHLANIAEASASVPAAGNHTAEPHRRRKRVMLTTILSTLAAKVAVGAVAAAAATGGLAATGSLPEPAQNAVASAVSHVGVHFPTKGQDASATDANEHGKTVSDTARNTELTGREKGQQVSETAQTKSQDHRQDAEHRQDGEHGRAPTADDGGQGAPSGRPNDYGKDNHPSGDPNGYGRDNHPSGNPNN